MHAGKKVKGIILLTALVLSLAVLSMMWLSSAPAMPVLSAESGFYDEAFDLVISVPAGSRVYYTLDGSMPDVQSSLYTGPIRIDHTLDADNIYSARTDVSAGFYTDLLEHYETWDEDPGYMTPDFKVDKCVVVRAAAIGPGGMSSGEVSATYFVGVGPERYHGCSVISIITDPDNLFDADRGIYVTGDVFRRNIYEKGKLREADEIGQYWRFWPANYRERGDRWEREAQFHIFDEHGAPVLMKAGGIRIHGGVSRGTLPKSLNLYARREYDGEPSFGANLFDNAYMPQRVFLSAGGNQLITLFGDYLMTERTRELNYATMLCKPYVMFLDGEYWGFYYLTEKYDEEYLAHYYGVDKNNVIMIKNGLIEKGTEDDFACYQEMTEFISGADMADENNYKKACSLIDMDSYIDYYAAMIYIARCEDWPGNNYALWRTRAVGDDPYSDGRWRWMMFDCNSTSMTAYYDLQHHDTIDYVMEYDRVFSALWQNTMFRKAFYDRLLYLADACFDAEAIGNLIDRYTQQMLPALEKSWKRFYGSENDKITEYYEEMENVRIFFNERKAHVLGWMKNE